MDYRPVLGRHPHVYRLALAACLCLALLVTAGACASRPGTPAPPKATAGLPDTPSPVAWHPEATATVHSVMIPLVSDPMSTPSVPAPAPAIPTPSSTPAPPAPSPSPTVSLPLPPENGSKLGVHGIWSNHILEFTQTLADAGAPFRIVKAVDDLNWLKDVRRISPATVTVGRLTQEHESAALVNDPNTDLDWYAGVLMEPILAKVRDDPALTAAVDYWELTNEPLGGGAPSDAYARLARVTMKAIEIAEANGLKLALFGFSAGTPEWPDMLAMAETGVFARAKPGGHILTLHEGVFGDDPIDKWWNAHSLDQQGNPTTQLTGVTAPGGWIPGGPVLDGAGALSLRYRFLYQLLEQRDEVIPLFISEFYAGGGFDLRDKAEIVARVHWYDLQVATDDYVLGFAPFTLGPVGEWTHHDFEPFYTGQDGLVAYMMGRPAEPSALPSSVAP